MANKASIFVLVLLCSGIAAQQLEWWQTSTIYQIYPRSFKDNLYADGIGDLLGITNNLNHLMDIGVGGIWLSPIFKSPMKDFGYDISDYRDIDPIFGTMEDMDNLIAECQSRGLKLILDFVPNHSSDEHDWFQQSIRSVDPYTDFYTWRNASGFDNSTNPLPPNNWLSVFGGSAWTWNSARQQFYLHQFHEGQPDLNFRNPLVRQEMNDVLRFWLDKGVDGFRVDAAAHLMEDQAFLDEPPSGNPGAEPDQWGYLNHIYTKDLPELFDIFYEFRATIDAKEEELGRPLLMIAEVYSDINNTMKYYGNETHDGAHFPFNFEFIWNVNNATDAQGLNDVVHKWMENMPAGRWANWVIGSHDEPRVASRFGRDFSVAVVIMGQLLPGTAITYNGEEIGMENTWISWEDTKDPQGCQAGPDDYEKFSRDPERTPFQWNDTPYAGFCPPDSSTPWLPVNDNYPELNLELQKAANNSQYHVYKKLTDARKNLIAAQTGTLVTAVLQEHIFAFAREVTSAFDSLLVVVNTDVALITVDVSAVAGVPETLNFYTGSLDAEYSDTEVVNATTVNVPARGGLVFTYKSSDAAKSSL